MGTILGRNQALNTVASPSVDVGLAADVEPLQRLSKVIGNQSVGEGSLGKDSRATPKQDAILSHVLALCSLANELAYTARKMMADEALESGLVR